MSKSMLATVVLGFLAGVAGASAVSLVGSEKVAVSTVPTGFNADASVDNRILALEAAVAAERDARQLLEDEIFALYAELEAPAEAPAEQRERRMASVEEARAQIEREQQQAPDRRQYLIDAGFSPDRAAWIAQREEELVFEAMQARYEARRSGEPRRNWPSSTSDLLRDEIGDAEYEQYLQANNLPVAIDIGRVMSASPAQTAGLQPGDQITHYNGERVYSTFDLTRQTMQGEAGESVVVNVLRDGAPMQVVMPRGPLGINARRGR